MLMIIYLDGLRKLIILEYLGDLNYIKWRESKYI